MEGASHSPIPVTTGYLPSLVPSCSFWNLVILNRFLWWKGSSSIYLKFPQLLVPFSKIEVEGPWDSLLHHL